MFSFLLPLGQIVFFNRHYYICVSLYRVQLRFKANKAVLCYLEKLTFLVAMYISEYITFTVYLMPH